MRRHETRGPRVARGSARARSARALLACERLLWSAGVLCLTVYALACAHASYTQAREREAFSRAIAEIEQMQVDQSEWSGDRMRKFEEVRAAPVEALARLDIPGAGVSVMVLEGTDDWTLNRGVGHIEGTARPGEGGNVGIAGHRDGFFRGLRHLEIGDSLTLTTLGGVAHYEVVDLRIVDPDDVSVLVATPDPTLTLVTCYPFYYLGDAPRRFIVRAERRRLEAWPASGQPERDAAGLTRAGRAGS